MMNLYVQELAGPGGSVLLSDMFLNLHETRSTVATDATCDGRSWGWKKKMLRFWR